MIPFQFAFACFFFNVNCREWNGLPKLVKVTSKNKANDKEVNNWILHRIVDITYLEYVKQVARSCFFVTVIVCSPTWYRPFLSKCATSCTYVIYSEPGCVISVDIVVSRHPHYSQKGHFLLFIVSTCTSSSKSEIGIKFRFYVLPSNIEARFML